MSAHRLTTPLLALAFLLGAAGCAGPRPQVKLIGLSHARTADAGNGHGDTLLVFLEVVNPTGRDLRLSRLEYRMRAPEWLDTAGRVELTRPLTAGSSAVVEVPVSLTRARGKMPPGATYTIEGKIFAREDRIERSWKVTVKGALAQASNANAPLTLRVADAKRN